MTQLSRKVKARLMPKYKTVFNQILQELSSSNIQQHKESFDSAHKFVHERLTELYLTKHDLLKKSLLEIDGIIAYLIEIKKSIIDVGVDNDNVRFELIRLLRTLSLSYQSCYKVNLYALSQSRLILESDFNRRQEATVNSMNEAGNIVKQALAVSAEMQDKKMRCESLAYLNLEMSDILRDRLNNSKDEKDKQIVMIKCALSYLLKVVDTGGASSIDNFQESFLDSLKDFFKICSDRNYLHHFFNTLNKVLANNAILDWQRYAVITAFPPLRFLEEEDKWCLRSSEAIKQGLSKVVNDLDVMQAIVDGVMQNIEKNTIDQQYAIESVYKLAEHIKDHLLFLLSNKECLQQKLPSQEEYTHEERFNFCFGELRRIFGSIFLAQQHLLCGHSKESDSFFARKALLEFSDALIYYKKTRLPSLMQQAISFFAKSHALIHLHYSVKDKLPALEFFINGARLVSEYNQTQLLRVESGGEEHSLESKVSLLTQIVNTFKKDYCGQLQSFFNALDDLPALSPSLIVQINERKKAFLAERVLVKQGIMSADLSSLTPNDGGIESVLNEILNNVKNQKNDDRIRQKIQTMIRFINREVDCLKSISDHELMMVLSKLKRIFHLFGKLNAALQESHDAREQLLPEVAREIQALFLASIAGLLEKGFNNERGLAIALYNEKMYDKSFRMKYKNFQLVIEIILDLFSRDVVQASRRNEALTLINEGLEKLKEVIFQAKNKLNVIDGRLLSGKYYYIMALCSKVMFDFLLEDKDEKEAGLLNNKKKILPLMARMQRSLARAEEDFIAIKECCCFVVLPLSEILKERVRVCLYLYKLKVLNDFPNFLVDLYDSTRYLTKYIANYFMESEEQKARYDNILNVLKNVYTHFLVIDPASLNEQLTIFQNLTGIPNNYKKFLKKIKQGVRKDDENDRDVGEAKNAVMSHDAMKENSSLEITSQNSNHHVDEPCDVLKKFINNQVEFSSVDFVKILLGVFAQEIDGIDVNQGVRPIREYGAITVCFLTRVQMTQKFSDIEKDLLMTETRKILSRFLSVLLGGINLRNSQPYLTQASAKILRVGVKHKKDRCIASIVTRYNNDAVLIQPVLDVLSDCPFESPESKLEILKDLGKRLKMMVDDLSEIIDQFGQEELRKALIFTRLLHVRCRRMQIEGDLHKMKCEKNDDNQLKVKSEYIQEACKELLEVTSLVQVQQEQHKTLFQNDIAAFHKFYLYSECCHLNLIFKKAKGEQSLYSDKPGLIELFQQYKDALLNVMSYFKKTVQKDSVLHSLNFTIQESLLADILKTYQNVFISEQLELLSETKKSIYDDQVGLKETQLFFLTHFDDVLNKAIDELSVLESIKPKKKKSKKKKKKKAAEGGVEKQEDVNELSGQDETMSANSVADFTDIPICNEPVEIKEIAVGAKNECVFSEVNEHDSRPEIGSLSSQAVVMKELTVEERKIVDDEQSDVEGVFKVDQVLNHIKAKVDWEKEMVRFELIIRELILNVLGLKDEEQLLLIPNVYEDEWLKEFANILSAMPWEKIETVVARCDACDEFEKTVFDIIRDKCFSLLEPKIETLLKSCKIEESIFRIYRQSGVDDYRDGAYKGQDEKRFEKAKAEFIIFCQQAIDGMSFKQLRKVFDHEESASQLNNDFINMINGVKKISRHASNCFNYLVGFYDIKEGDFVSVSQQPERYSKKQSRVNHR